MTFETVRFPSHGVELHGWLFPAAHDGLATAAGRPCAVMAHGLAGTKDSGLEAFAVELADAGLEVLAFDYRGFGRSALPGVDPSRLVLWGTSLAGGHVLTVAAGREDIAAVVALTPMVDGLAAGRHALSSHPPAQLVKSTLLGLRAKLTPAGRPPVMMPVVGEPGSTAALTLEGLKERYLSIAGPSWRNEIGAAVTTELGAHRPIKDAKDVQCPVLVQIADFDRSAPPHAAAKAAFLAHAEVRRYPCDHFDVYEGGDWHDAAVAHQVRCLVRHLAPSTVTAPSAS